MSLRTYLRLFTHLQMLPVLESGEETLVGGQAVVEGVMMRAPHSYCVAVRKASGEIVTQEMPLEPISDRRSIFKKPVFRGVGTLYQAMKLGLKAMQYSLNMALDDPRLQPQDQKAIKEVPGWAITGNVIFAVLFFILLYKFVPLYIATQLEHVFPVLGGRIAFNLVDGVIRLAIFLTFMWTMSRSRDIRRLFEYHGAEHKVVFNFESGQPVTVENAQRFTTFHPRCGTSFVLMLMLVSMVVYPFIPFDGFVAKFLSRLALLPLIVGVSYELIRFAARRRGSTLAAFAAPGLWSQRITTKQPTDEQTEVAIRALEGAMALEKSQGGQLVIA